MAFKDANIYCQGLSVKSLRTLEQSKQGEKDGRGAQEHKGWPPFASVGTALEGLTSSDAPSGGLLALPARSRFGHSPPTGATPWRRCYNPAVRRSQSLPLSLRQQGTMRRIVYIVYHIHIYIIIHNSPYIRRINAV